MKLHEAEARELLRRAGLPVPDGEVADSPVAARAAAERLFARGAAKVVIKAQVLVGGRGKAGDRKSTRLNSSHMSESRMPSSA